MATPPALGPVIPLLEPVLAPVIEIGVGELTLIFVSLFGGNTSDSATDLEGQLEQVTEELTNPSTSTQIDQEYQRILACWVNSLPGPDSYGCGCTTVADISDILDDIQEMQDALLEIIPEFSPSIDSLSACELLFLAMRRLITDAAGEVTIQTGIADRLQSVMLCRSLDGTRHQRYCKERQLVRVCKTFATDVPWFSDPRRQEHCTICAARSAPALFTFVATLASSFAVLLIIMDRLKCNPDGDGTASQNRAELLGAFCDYMESIAALFSFGECPKECVDYEMVERYVNVPC